MAAIDIALWDIKGQYENVAVNKFLGKVISERLPLYVSGLRRVELSERMALGKEVINQGFRGVKIFTGASAEKTIAECQAIRSAIGPDAELAFDAICSQDYASAYTIGRSLDELNASWFESPIDPEDIAGHAKLAKTIKTPLAIGEPLRTVREFEPWINQKAMKIAQPDIMRCGITGGRDIIKLAQNHNLRIAPHIGVCTAIGVAATWHVTSVLHNPLSQEHQLDMFETANKVLTTPLSVETGHAIVPKGAGLGIEVNESFIVDHSPERWTITGSEISHHVK